MMETNKRSDELQEEALRNEKVAEIKAQVDVEEVEATDDFGKIKLIPTPNFTGCNSIGTLLPTNLANDTIRNLSNVARKTDLIEFIKIKLGYSTNLKVCASFDSEQIEALTLAITSFEKGNAFILGDMAGIGKGRICAGAMRYAYQQGLIPVFFSFKPYLFNDIYRDLQDIGFFGFEKNDRKKIAEVKPFILHPDGTITDRENPEGAPPLHAPMSYANTNFVCQEITKRANKGKYVLSNPRLGYDFNCVFLPYSTVSMTRTTIKQEFLEAIAPNSLLIFDESHNAASAQENSNILKRTMPLVEKCKGVLFSSATYAKNPDVFKLYIVRTALRSAVPSLESINAALKVGGENVAEYIATGLVYEGQMIRRERSFGNCPKITEYVGTRRQRDDETNTNKYIQLPGEPAYQRNFYNEAIGYFKELRDFSRSELGKSGIKKAIERKCMLDGKELVDDSMYYEMVDNWKDFRNQPIATPSGIQNPRTKADVIAIAQRRFIESNRGKWAVVGGLKVDSVNRYKSTFRENLFLAIKAKFAADKIIECLETPVNYTNFDGSEHVAPMKPVVAIKNTAEAIFNELKLDEGQIVRNDFSEYLRAIYKKLFRGRFTLRKVTNNFFESKQQLIDRGTWSDSLETTLAYEVSPEDFADGGEKIMAIQSRLDNYTSNLPFSTIDYLIDKIQRKERNRIYYENNNRAMPPKYGEAGSQYYSVGEVTARDYMLRRVGDSEDFEFVKNDRDKSATTAFRKFNNGGVDVLIINVVGSTGGSIQSNPKEGIDTRPRNMITIQFEWDINVEIQKRGRVNRTGQLNAPTYTYIISQIPVELRTYLMFRKKLRKLDANTSADQSISAKSSEVVNVEGGVVQDILNMYGFEAFTDNFITLIENEPYKRLYDKFKGTKNAVSFVGAAEHTEYSLERFNEFIRELELYPTDGNENEVNQEYFFNRMNKIYAEKIELLKTLGKYQLELDTKSYKAKLRGKLVIQLNSGSTIFSKPLFISDYYTLENKEFITRSKLEAKITSLCKSPTGEAITPNEYQSNLVENFTTEAARMLRQFMETFDEQKPLRENYPNDEDYNKDLVRFNSSRISEETERKRIFNSTLVYLRFFKPGMLVKYYSMYGRFLGYSIEDTGSKFKYSEGSIIFHFAFLTGIPYAKYRLSSGRAILHEIVEETKLFDQRFNEYANMVTRNEDQRNYLDKLNSVKERVDAWQPQKNRRIIRRFLSGNILSGIVYANNYLNNPMADSGLTTSVPHLNTSKTNPMTDWVLTRFTTVDGGYETAIECQYDYELYPERTELKAEDTNLLVSVGSSEVMVKLKELPFISELQYRVLSETGGYSDDTFDDLDYQKVVWNGNDNDRGVIPRSVCMYKREVNGRECIYVEIMNPYRVLKDAKVFYVAPEKNNIIYHDTDLLNNFREFELDTEGSRGRIIYYARYKRNLSSAEVKDIKKIKSDESGESIINLGASIPYEIVKTTYKVFIKTYVFDLQTSKRNLNNLFQGLHEKYNLSMNFKSSTDLYWFVPQQEDIVDISQAKSEQRFPDGEYVYSYTGKPDPSITIPYQIGQFNEEQMPPYGGVVLKQPIAPMQLRSYNIVPNDVPNKIKVQLLLAALTPEDKTLIIKKLQELKEADAFDIGVFMQEFVEPKTTDLRYFFGDLTVSEFGELMKKYINEEDLTQFLTQRTSSSTEVQRLTEQPRTIKSSVDLDDAERFLMNLLR